MRPLFQCIVAVAAFLVALLPGVQAENQDLDWRTFVVPDFGTSVYYPAGIFAPAGDPAVGTGRRFERAEGRAMLSIYSRPNEADETPGTYLKHNLRMDRSALDYTQITRSFFAISSERDGVILYSRCNFSRGGRGAIHCFDLEYPRAEKRNTHQLVAAAAARLSASLQETPGQSQRCGCQHSESRHRNGRSH